jgi:hypothetical protein
MVVAIIALGGSKTIHELTYRCVNSIRRRGAWSGPIIVFVNCKIEDLQGLDDQQVTFVEITPKQQSEVTLLPGRMKYKRLKMDLIRQTDNMAQFRNMTYILYLDVDVVVGDSLDDFVSEQVAAMDKMYNISSPSFFWAFYQSTTRAHSGIMLLHRRFWKNGRNWSILAITRLTKMHSQSLCFSVDNKYVAWNVYQATNCCFLRQKQCSNHSDRHLCM